NVTAVEVEVGTQTSGFDVDDVDFANFERMDLSGYKFGDFNNDTEWSEGEVGLEGWTIVIDFDDNPDNGYFLSTTTDENGYYSFTGLAPDTLGDDGVTLMSDDADGVYYIYEIQQDGFTQTSDGGYSFTMTSGLDVHGQEGVEGEGNFGNYMLEGANRTPGFWQSTLGFSLYNGDDDDNGDANGDGVPDGKKNFDEEGWSTTDLLTKYGVDTDLDGTNDSFILWDEDGDGEYDAGDDIFLTPEQLRDWVGGGDAGERDYTTALERDLGATFLNTLNNHSLATPESDSEDPLTGQNTIDGEIYDSYTAAVEFILKYDSDLDGISTVGKQGQRGDWNNGTFGVDGLSGSDAHTELAAYNENGDAIVEGAAQQIVMDGDDHSSAFVQNYSENEEQMLIKLDPLYDSMPKVGDPLPPLDPYLAI
ncbi:hypothetical protein, partial [Qipengyuania sphaerica]|uniref:hypothetical protein n=1 Tax=Qipengyuania sphaerica TaxID=2867243 RepID=UPI001C898D34